jgi:cell division protein FtsW (lipid II flippase)
MRYTTVGRANANIVAGEKLAKKFVDENEISKLLIAGIFMISIIGIVYGSVYVYECTTKKDDTVNYGLYWSTYPFIVLSTLIIALTSYRYGKKKIGRTNFWLIVIGLIFIILFAQTGVYNAIATPNDPQWNEAGHILGSIVIVMGLVFLGLGSFLTYKNWKN